MKFCMYLLIISLPALLSGCVLLQGSDSCPMGFKRAKAGNCVQDMSCMETEACINAGKCTYAPGDLCVATRPIDCAQSENCKNLGECHFQPNYIGEKSYGKCVADEKGCLASQICAEYGKCTPGSDGFCVVDGDADCASASVCRDMGRCTAKKVPRTDGKRSRPLSCQQ